MNTVAVMHVIIIPGKPTRIHSFVVIGFGPRSLIETVITFALEPIGVALPPNPAPIASAQNRGAQSRLGSASPIPMMTGIIAAVNGILSTIALAIAETQIMATANMISLEPKLSNIQLARSSR